ncbi:unnamed protein product [Tilletia laevis]|nr:unnamed protein product [Tilletia laevis]
MDGKLKEEDGEAAAHRRAPRGTPSDRHEGHDGSRPRARIIPAPSAIRTVGSLNPDPTTIEQAPRAHAAAPTAIGPRRHSRCSSIGRQQPQDAIWALATQVGNRTRREVKDATLLGRQQASLCLDTRIGTLNPCGQGSGTSPTRRASRIRKRLAS